MQGPKVVAMATLHNVFLVQCVFRANEQAQTYPKICVLVSYLTYICNSLFECAENTILHIFVD